MNNGLRRLLRLFGWHDLSTVAAIIGVVSLARLGALTSGLSSDDYTFLGQGTDWIDYWPVHSQGGRPIAAWIMYGMAKLGGPQPHAFPPAVALSIVCFAAVGYLIARRWFLVRGRHAVVVASLVAAHPFLAELFTFRQATLLSAFALLLSVVAVAAFPPRRRYLLPASAALVLGLAIYQIGISLAVYLVLSLAAYLAVNGLRAGANRRQNAYLLHRLLFAVSVVGLGTVLYFVIIQALSVTGVAPLAGGRTPLLSPGEIPGRLTQIMEVAREVFVTSDALIPGVVKLFLLVPLLLAVAAAVLPSNRRADWRRTPGYAALLVLSITGLVLSVAGINTIIKEWWIVPRVLGHTSVFWAWPVAVLCRTSRPAFKTVALTCSTIALLSYLLIGGRVLEDQKRINRRDAALANRIVSRIESLDGARAVRSVVVVNPPWSYPDDNVITVGNLNVSGLFATWSQEALIEETTGVDLTLMATQEDRDQAQAYCRDQEVWPAPRSVTVQGQLAIVCFQRR